MKILDDNILRKVIRKRPKNSHKGDYGRVLIVGGNAQYGGAAILASSAAVYAGAGLVTVATDKVNHAALHARLPEAMVIDWTMNFPIETYDVIVIGCGLGLGLAQLQLFKRALAQRTENQWLIIDGSAITLFAENQLTLKFPKQTVFTPHQMELQQLSGIKILHQNVQNVQEFVDRLGVTIVAKSSETKIFRAGEEALALTIGLPAQATGGMGDTLAGLVGGFLGQFSENSFAAIAAATYLHSRAAAEISKTNYVVLPSRLIEQIPIIMKSFEKNQ